MYKKNIFIFLFTLLQVFTTLPRWDTFWNASDGRYSDLPAMRNQNYAQDHHRTHSKQ